MSLDGTLVRLDPAAPDRVEVGSVVLGDDGLVSHIRPGRAAPVPAGVRRVVTGRSWVFPGLIDLHSHVAYNALPLWTEPSRLTPFADHDSWPRRPTYKPAISWPAWTLARCAPEALLAYVLGKALAGGTTAVQGSPSGRRPPEGWLIRLVDDESFGTGNRNLIRTSALTIEPQTLLAEADTLSAGGFVYHCGEGRRGSAAAAEYDAVRNAGLLTDRLVAIHLSAVTGFPGWNPPGGVVWSPFSNLWLYGETTDVPAARDAGLLVCLGTDWSPSGTPNLLGELKVARLAAAAAGWQLSDRDLVSMVTSNPGDLLSRCWPHPAGRLVPGALGDVSVIARRTDDPWRDLVTATERDVRLVVVGSRARYGTPGLMRAAGAVDAGPVTVAGARRAITLSHPGTGAAWSAAAVRADLERVRADPAAALAADEQRRLQGVGGPGGGAPSLDLVLDMPTGDDDPTAGPPPDPSVVVIPPLVGWTASTSWLASVRGRGFHGGVLDALSGFYR